MSNSEDIVTRCPQCNTAFRVTLNQLAVADGQVRCGSCLAVFKAMDHNAKEESKSTTNQKPSTQQTDTQPVATKAKKGSPSHEALNKPSTSPATEKSGSVKSTPARLKTATKTEVESVSKAATPAQQTKITSQKATEPSDAQDILIADEEKSVLDLDGDIFDLDSENKNKKTSLFDRSLATVKEHKRESADESWAIKMLAELEEEDHQEEEDKTQFIIGSEPTENTDNLLNSDGAKIEPSFNSNDSTDRDLGFYDDDDETSEQESSGYDQIDLKIDLETNDTTTRPQNNDSPIYFEEDIATVDSKNTSESNPD